ncbi:hypothetical protein [Actinocatenispora sera]|uniref:Uncharacterized protein n=1 Tax=Actinocatenispora sera TaxID=390989 RepID=A0A810L382_9ACTN|nr:hypothetical protein [Actinocatenispora sera]BCJ29082.1 hypothetical protein Asera_31900 [Actinocatenispora sera]
MRRDPERRTVPGLPRRWWALWAGGAVAALLGLSAPAGAAPTTPTATPLPATDTTTVTLPTGDHVTVSGAGTGKPTYTVEPSRHGGVHSVQTAAGDHYVIPAVATPYLGRQLDLSLFDVTTMAARGIDDGARIPVRLSFADGVTPTAPAGVTLTAVRGTTARGYLTAKSASALATAARHRIGADVAAGRAPGSTPLFAGMTRMSLDAASVTAKTVTPHYPLYTLQVNGIDADGNTPDYLPVFITNTDSAARADPVVELQGSSERVMVPAGHYTAQTFGDSFDEQGDQSKNLTVVVDDFTVAASTAPSQVTLDLRTATSPVTVSTPKPAVQDVLVTTYYRFDATGASFGFENNQSGDAPIYVNPQPAATTGRLHYLVHWIGAPADQSYRYDVAFASDDGVAADQSYRVRSDQLATVHHHLYHDPGDDGRYTTLLGGPTDPQIAPQWGVPAMASPIPAQQLPADVTMYVGTADSGQWGNAVATATADLAGDGHTYLAGHEYSIEWGRGPIVPGLGQFTGARHVCYSCSAGDALSLGMPMQHDAVPDHTSGSALYPAQAHFILYRNGTLIADQDRALGATVTGVPDSDATYRGVLDTTMPADSGATLWTKTHTEVTVKYSPGTTGSPLPAGDYCAIQDGDTPCQVLPVLTLNYRLAVDRQNTSSAAIQAMGLRVGHVSYDGAGSSSPIASAKVSVSFDHGDTWRPAHVLGAAGTYAVTWRNPASAAGTAPMLRVRATDANGDAIEQTITAAYQLAAAQ